MKLTYRQIDGFVKDPDPKARAILVYGPDDGLMRERAKTMAASVVADTNDPFNVTVLGADDLIEDPARLFDEAGAMSMMGGAKLIRIENAADKLAPLFKDYLNEPSAENLVILEAGELGPRSALRKLFESSKNAAAVPCYIEDERDIASLIRENLQDAGYTINAESLTWLAANIAGDRMRARGEINKLITYMGADKAVTLEHAQAACGEAGAQSLDDLVYAIAGTNPQAALKFFEKLLAEGVQPVMILRSVQNHFRKLHLTKALMAQGSTTDQAMKMLQPPIFFKYEQPFKSQLNRWQLPTLQKILGRLSEIEAQTKQTGIPAETLCAQAFLSISNR